MLTKIIIIALPKGSLLGLTVRKKKNKTKQTLHNVESKLREC